MTNLKITNRACVEKVVATATPDVLKIVENLAINGNPGGNWPNGNTLAVVHQVQACPAAP